MVNNYHNWPGRSMSLDHVAFHAVMGVPLVSGRWSELGEAQGPVGYSRDYREMLGFADLQTGQALELYRGSTDLVALCRQVGEEDQHHTDRHSIQVEGAVPELTGLNAKQNRDAPRLERVLDNLISNAVKYSPKGGRITVEVAKDEMDEEWAVFAMRDQGIGISASDLPYLFEWFRRAGNVSGRIGGTGMGLASARQVVEQHGGVISVASKEGQAIAECGLRSADLLRAALSIRNPQSAIRSPQLRNGQAFAA